MSKNMKRITWIALLLVLVIAIPATLAYFTDYDTVEGVAPIKLGETTEIEEPKVGKWNKEVLITANSDSDPVFIRAIAYGPDKYPLEYSGEGWTEKDGFYEYANPIAGADTEYVNDPYNLATQTTTLSINITNVAEEDVGFHVVVVYEATPAIWDGSTWTCDWNNTVVIE